VKKLSEESEGVDTFVTLSPIPGFANWLISKLHMNIEGDKFKDGTLLTPDERVRFFKYTNLLELS
jgi:hypothetical protein